MTEPQNQRADLLKRFLAIAIDNMVCFFISLLPALGLLLAAAYILFRDGFEWKFLHYRSLGKKIMKIKIVMCNGKTTHPDLNISIKRNWMLALPALLSIIPFSGWMLAFPTGILVWCIEGAKVILNPQGRRFGDGFAHTFIVEEIPKKLSPAVTEEPLSKKDVLLKRMNRF